MTTSAERFDAALRRHGHRVTRPRRAVFAVLADADEHLTVERIEDLVTATGEDVNLASVYRTLALLDELGLARETRLGGGAATWELAHPDEHFHLVCEACGRVDHHVGSLVADLVDHLADDEHRFEARRVELTVSGRCADCVDADRPADTDRS